MHIGDEIRKLREEKGYTQSQLASGFTTASYISQIEKGKVMPSRKVLFELAKRLDRPTYHFEALATQLGNWELSTKLERFEALARAMHVEQAEEVASDITKEESPLWDSATLGKLAFCRGCLARAKGDLDDSLYYLRQSLEHFEKCGYVSEVAKCLDWLARVHRDRDDIEMSSSYVRRAIALLAETNHDPELLYNHKLSLALNLFTQGKLVDALKIYQSLQEACLEVNSAARVSLLLGLSHTYERLGNTHLAFEYASKGRILAEQNDYKLVVAVAERVMADGLTQSGQYDAALEYLDRALAKQVAEGKLVDQATLLLKKAKVYAFDERVSAAQECIQTVKLKYGQNPVPLSMQAEIYSVTGLLQQKTRELDAAIDSFLLAGEIFNTAGRVNKASENLQQAADLLLLREDKSEAYATLKMALKLALQIAPDSDIELK